MIYPVAYDNGGYRSYCTKQYNGLWHPFHDFNVDEKTTVYSVNPGKVLKILFVDGFGGRRPVRKGFTIFVLHNNHNIPYIAQYGHVSPVIDEGDKLNEGQYIGNVHGYYIGHNQKNVPHLHFGIWLGYEMMQGPYGYMKNIEKWMNPLKFLEKNKAVWPEGRK